jgi:hypothetical protein
MSTVVTSHLLHVANRSGLIVITKTVKPTDTELQRALIKAAAACHVTLSFDEQPASFASGFVLLLGWSKENIAKAVKAIHFLLSAPRAGVDHCPPRYIVEASPTKQSALELSSHSSPPGGHRVKLPKVERLIELEDEENLATEEAVNSLGDQFMQQFRMLSTHLRHTPEGMNMRLDFGVACFHQAGHQPTPPDKTAALQTFTIGSAEKGTGKFKPE